MFVKPYMNRFRKSAIALRVLARLLHLWPFLFLAGLYISPISPHMLLQYRYIEHSGGMKEMTQCQYLGLHGLRFYQDGSDCPAIVMLNRGEWF